MKRRYILAGAALALTSSLALASPESLLPPVFNQPAPRACAVTISLYNRTVGCSSRSR